ncbi:MAG: ethanolamine utilization protein EutN [Planctomycetaceae bacterium]|jgi:ethanolamine utilization protein EutN|nr:ethanolamine utilization protein EutN [Planctomycetaceae bacterium]
MIKGTVIGTATATIKHPTLDGWKMLIVRADAEPYIAVDKLGAGVGDEVLMTSDGKFTSELIGTKATPIRWSVIGITDNRKE